MNITVRLSIQKLLQSWDALANSTATSIWETAYRQSWAAAAQELRNTLHSSATPTESALVDLARICGATIAGPENAGREYAVFGRHELMDFASMLRDDAVVIVTPAADPAEACVWTHDEDEGTYHSACGHAFSFTDGGLPENGVHYCWYCGKQANPAAKPSEEAEALCKALPLLTDGRSDPDAARYRHFFASGLPITFLGIEYDDKTSLDAAIDADLAQEGQAL